MAQYLEAAQQAATLLETANDLIKGVKGSYDKFHSIFNELSSTVNSIYSYFATKYQLTPQLMYAQSFSWLYTDHFSAIINKVLLLDFSREADRYQAFDLLQSCRISDLKGNKRLPKNVSIVSMYYEPYSTPFLIALSALCVPKKATLEVYEKHLNDYTRAILELNKYYFSGKYYFTRKSFEAKFDLILE